MPLMKILTNLSVWEQEVEALKAELATQQGQVFLWLGLEGELPLM